MLETMHEDEPGDLPGLSAGGGRSFSSSDLHTAGAPAMASSMLTRTHTEPRLAPLANPEEANPLRRRVEACLLQRERTVEQLLSWLRTMYRVQENVGAKYALGDGDLRRWSKLSRTTRDDHRLKAALLLAALRMHTLELVEALEDWRKSRPRLRIVLGSGREVELARPFVWRGRWWPLQLCLDPPMLPLPLSLDPLLLRWFERGDGGDADHWSGPAAGHKGQGGSAPPELFSAPAWHPPAIMERLRAADTRVTAELRALELHGVELLRERLQVKFGSPAWTSDGASIQLARLIYGGAKPYVSGCKAKMRRVERAMAEEEARELAATRLQAAARGRYARTKRVAQHEILARPKKQQVNARHSLRKEAGGSYAGISVKFDAAACKAAGKSVQEGLREALTANASRVIDLFRMWDVDGNGTISKKEFHRAMREIGVEASKEDLYALFEYFDADKGGLLEVRELQKVLRRGAGDDIKLATNLEAGAVGFDKTAKNQHSLRRHARDGTSARSGLVATIPNIKKAMAEMLLRTKDIMTALDTDSDGAITKDEFRNVLPLLGFDRSSSVELDALFDTFDKDAGGTIDYEELHALLRKELEPGVDAEIAQRDAAAVKLQSIHRGRSARKLGCHDTAPR
jgi:Ca2+-binding EF-hand superfamily protein